MTAGAVAMVGPRRSTRCRCQRHALMLDSQRGAMRAARVVYDPNAGSKRHERLIHVSVQRNNKERHNSCLRAAYASVQAVAQCTHPQAAGTHCSWAVSVIPPARESFVERWMVMIVITPTKRNIGCACCDTNAPPRGAPRRLAAGHLRTTTSRTTGTTCMRCMIRQRIITCDDALRMRTHSHTRSTHTLQPWTAR